MANELTRDGWILWEYAFENPRNYWDAIELDSHKNLVLKVAKCLKDNGYDVEISFIDLPEHSHIVAVTKCLKGIYGSSHDYDEYYYFDHRNPTRTILSDAVIEVLDQEFPREEDWALFVSCEDCDEGEELGADDPRHHFDLFEFDMDTETFTCKKCGKVAQQEYYDHSKEGD